MAEQPEMGYSLLAVEGAEADQLVELGGQGAVGALELPGGLGDELDEVLLDGGAGLEVVLEGGDAELE
jgi:hypothetical protein